MFSHYTYLCSLVDVRMLSFVYILCQQRHHHQIWNISETIGNFRKHQMWDLTPSLFFVFHSKCQTCQELIPAQEARCVCVCVCGEKCQLYDALLTIMCGLAKSCANPLLLEECQIFFMSLWLLPGLKYPASGYLIW